MIRLVILIAAVGAIALLLVPRWRPTARRWMGPAIVITLALLYLRSPIDLIPDVGPVGFLDDLVVLLASLWWVRQRQRDGAARIGRENRARTATDRPVARSDHEPWDPYRILEIEPGATEEEITRAYRTQMKRYHPDRVEGLGDELRELAHSKTREIQRAYDELRSH